jgi:acyl-CoA synthetase (AMP-forming)/AMP-acid ligase II
MELNLADLFEVVSDEVPDALAMVSDSRRLTYGGLDRRADRLAHHLLAAGVGPDDRVGVQLANGTEYIETMLACFKIRAVPVNVNYRYVTRELEYLYANAGLVGLVFHRRFGPAVIGALGTLTDRRAILEVADGAPAVDVGVEYEDALAASPEGRDFPARSAGDSYCVYTGGTTGMPKGVLWRHDDIFFAAMGGGDPFAAGNHIARPEELADRVLRPGITALAVPPFMHAAGHWLAFSTLFGGGTVVTTPGGIFEPVEVWRLVEAERANAVVVVGDAMARPLLDVLAADPDRFDLSSLMAVGSGGAVLSPSTKSQLAELLPGRIVADRFGSSETGQVGGEAPADDPFGPPRLRVDERTTVLDDDLRPVAPGSDVIGHLARGGRVPLGYLGDPDASATTFVVRDGTRWALPGDQASVAADGTITVHGRGSLCINTGGEKVFPDEVEAALKGHPHVADALVVGLDDERFGQRVVALVQVRPGREVGPEELRAHGHELLTGYKVPRQFVFVDEIVRSPSGKPDYPHARSVAEAHAAATGD